MVQILALEYRSSVSLQTSVYGLTYTSCGAAVHSRGRKWAIRHHWYLWIPRWSLPGTGVFVVQSSRYIVCSIFSVTHAWADLFHIFERLFKRIIQTRSPKSSFQGLNKTLKACKGQIPFPQLFLKILTNNCRSLPFVSGKNNNSV